MRVVLVKEGDKGFVESVHSVVGFAGVEQVGAVSFAECVVDDLVGDTFHVFFVVHLVYIVPDVEMFVLRTLLCAGDDPDGAEVVADPFAEGIREFLVASRGDLRHSISF